jgi:hypothetical protein
VSRDVRLRFFHQTQLLLVPIGTCRNLLDFSKIRGVIRIRNWLSGGVYTGESIRIPCFFSNINHMSLSTVVKVTCSQFRIIILLKIVLCSFKSVKGLPDVQTTPQGVLTPLWWTHRGISTPLWWIHWGVDLWCIWNTHQNRSKKADGDKQTREYRLPSVVITGKSWLPGVFCTSRFFVNQL